MPPEPGDAGGSPREALSSGMLALGLPVDGPATDRLLAYQAMLDRWGRVYNLTALREPSQVLVQHLLDSLSVVRPLQRTLGREVLPGLPPSNSPGGTVRLLDVGSGAGLPGVVAAVMMPGVQVVCVDAVAKKAGFIRQVAVELGLKNLQAVHGRVEAMGGELFHVIASRAFASLADFVTLSQERLAPRGVWLAMKGREPAEELAQLPEYIEAFHVEQLRVPGLQAERCLVWLRKR